MLEGELTTKRKAGPGDGLGEGRGADEYPPYTEFASIYDAVMRDVSYQMWANYVEEICARHGLAPATILDVACGTGGSTLPFAARGYQIAGVDASQSMLDIARAKAAASGLGVEFALQDLRRLRPGDLALGPVFDLVLCLYDSLNYITDPRELQAALPGFLGALRPGGLFIFDVNAARRLTLMSEALLFLEGPGWAFIEKNAYDPATFIWEITATGFVRSRGGLYRRFMEIHRERSYSEKEIRGMLARSGFRTLAAYAAFDFEPAGPDTARVYFVAQRPG
jgi:SAM-dependent methyltransferase